MELNPAAVSAYKTILMNPPDHGIPIRPIQDSFKSVDIVTPKHILFQQYVDQIQKPLPKVFFYIIMDEMYFDRIGKAATGDLGYALELLPINQPSPGVKGE